MTTLYTWSKYNNTRVPHTGYTTSYVDGNWSSESVSYSTENTQPNLSGYRSYSFSQYSGYSYSNYDSHIAAFGGTFYSGGSTSITKTTGYDPQYDSGSGVYMVGVGTSSKSASTTQTPYTYYTDAQGTLVSTFYDTYDAYTSGSKSSDGYWYVRGALYNTDPTISLTKNGTAITTNQQFIQSDQSDFTFEITGNDVDTTDTIQYKVRLVNTDITPYTDTIKQTSNTYTIPYTSLVLGSNTVTVSIKDSKGYSVSQSFIIQNKTPQTLSLQSLLDTEIALGYANTSDACLQTLMPSGYSGNLSISDFINFLS